MEKAFEDVAKVSLTEEITGADDGGTVDVGVGCSVAGVSRGSAIVGTGGEAASGAVFAVGTIVGMRVSVFGSLGGVGITGYAGLGEVETIVGDAVETGMGRDRAHHRGSVMGRFVSGCEPARHGFARRSFETCDTQDSRASVIFQRCHARYVVLTAKYKCEVVLTSTAEIARAFVVPFCRSNGARDKQLVDSIRTLQRVPMAGVQAGFFGGKDNNTDGGNKTVLPSISRIIKRGFKEPV